MTNEEAIEYWKYKYDRAIMHNDIHYDTQECKQHEEYVKNLEMAIKALETVSCIKEKCAYCPHCENCDVDDETLEIKALEQQPCEDYISRQAVINTIHQNCVFENEYNLTASRIKNLVQQMSPVTPKKKTGWIPVSERLPEESKRYVVTTKYNDVMTDFYTGEGFLGDDIIAWMPLPEPYKAESEDKEIENDREESDAEFMCKAMSKTVNKSIADNNFIGGF